MEVVAGTSGYDEFYALEYRAVVAFAWSLTGSRSVGEELAQDAFLDAFRRWDRLLGYDRPGAWVRRAVANRAVSTRRRALTEARGLRRLVVEQGDPEVTTATDQCFWDAPFWAEVRALPARQAQCVALHYLEDRPVEEIADVLGCRVSTVKVHLYRGRLELARRLVEPRSDQREADQ
jgi:RNA polymerase sigma-70 factor (ECF subfamily)